MPELSIRAREVNSELELKAKALGLPPIIARVLASRDISLDAELEDFLIPKLANLTNPNLLRDITKASARIADAIIGREIIGIETDHDCDGQTSHAVMYTSLVNYFNYPKEKIRSYIGHRLEEGYGLSEALADRILQDSLRPTIIVTADNGSTDELRIKKLLQHGIETIVTDHHEIPQEGPPKSAYAVLNPTRQDCAYPDKYIAGCMVAWLLMTQVRQQLLAKNYMDYIPNLKGLLDFVAVGTVADCVSIAKSTNNRAVVKYGLNLIAKWQRPCWQALRAELQDNLSSEALGFVVGPLLNSDGRLDSAFGSVSFLLAKDVREAQQWVEHLKSQNQTRKNIQKRLFDLCKLDAAKQAQAGKVSICIFLPDGHAGVHGIVASRIKDLFGMPTVIFSPKLNDNQVISGSCRGLDNHFHMREALATIAAKTQIIKAFGGHRGAAGVTIAADGFSKFVELFESAVLEQIDHQQIGPVLLTDGRVGKDELCLDFVRLLNQYLQPFGREFEAPSFEIQAMLINLEFVGQESIHARVTLKLEDVIFEAIWFNVRDNAEQEVDLPLNSLVDVVFAPKINTFMGRSKFNPQILTLSIS